jgi:hypothetical protein
MPSFETNVPLLCHPSTPCTVIDDIGVAVSGGPRDRLSLTYRLRGRIDDVRIPAPLPGGRADGLWRHTCCEAFIARAGAPGYREFDFSPSGQWAEYVFRAYRQRDPDATLSGVPHISPRRELDTWVLMAQLPAGAAFPPGNERLELNLAVVVEATDGALSYWALRHPMEKPDFHARRGFALELAAPGPIQGGTDHASGACSPLKD